MITRRGLLGSILALPFIPNIEAKAAPVKSVPRVKISSQEYVINPSSVLIDGCSIESNLEETILNFRSFDVRYNIGDRIKCTFPECPPFSGVVIEIRTEWVGKHQISSVRAVDLHTALRRWNIS